jgi:hypothetical protein
MYLLAIAVTVNLTLCLPTNALGQTHLQLPREDHRLGATFKTLFVVGQAEGDGPETFGSVDGIAFDEGGNLYVFDRLSKRVVVFDTKGRLLRTVGRSGGGPGEFLRPTSFTVFPSGSIVVRDRGIRGYHLFKPDGGFDRVVREARIAAPAGGIRSHPDGGVVVQAITYDSTPRATRIPVVTLIYQPLGTTDRSRRLAVMQGKQRFAIPGAVSSPTSMTIQSAGGPKRFEMQPTWTVLPNGSVVYADEPSYILRIRDAVSGRERRITRPIAARQWRLGELARVRARIRASFTTQSASWMPHKPGVTPMPATEIDQAMKNLEFSELVPPITRITNDTQGRIWVGRNGSNVMQDGLIDLISSTGAYLGTLTSQPLPDAFGPHNRAAYIVRDEMDVARVVVKQISGLP